MTRTARSTFDVDRSRLCDETDAIAHFSHTQAEIHIAAVKLAVNVVPPRTLQHIASRHHQSAGDERNVRGLKVLHRLMLPNMTQMEPRHALGISRRLQVPARMLHKAIRVD